jgi:hypothetical protein
MRWLPSFRRARKPHVVQPFRKHFRPLLEELESRLVPATSVLSYHGNFATNTGQKLSEFLLTPANVNSSSFGKLYSTAVDGQVYAEPLAVAGVNIPNQGTHNVVYIATEHDSVYAIDQANGQVLWQTSFINPSAGITTLSTTDVASSDISPEYGITATPVIDATTSTIYVVANTKEAIGGRSHNIYRLHALDLSTGQEKFGGPALIADTMDNGNNNFTYVAGPSIPGTGVGSVNGTLTFNAVRQLARMGLTLINGTVFMGFGSHNDNDPYHGWILGYNASNLKLSAAFCDTPNGEGGGIWEGGGKIAVDDRGYLYIETGDGTFETTANSAGFPNRGDYGDTVLKLAIDPTTTASNPNTNGWGVNVVDYFTPFNQATFDANDTDLGSGGVLILPDSVGSAAHLHLLVAEGKEGRLYLIDRDNMTHFHSDSDRVVESIPGAFPKGHYGTPAFFNNTIYTAAFNDTGKTFSIASAFISPTPTSASTDTYGFPGSTPMISSNGTINGIVWDIDRGSGQLRAYDAAGYNTELYTSAQAPNGRDSLGTANKFTVPTIVDGQVFVGTSNSLVAYGLLQPPTAAPAAPSNLVAAAASASQVNLSWSDNGLNEGWYSIEAAVDGVNFTQHAVAPANATSVDVTSLQPGTTYTFRVRALNVVGASGYSDLATTQTLMGTSTGGVSFASGFPGSTTSLSLNGSAKISGTTLQLTDGRSGEAGSVFTKSPVDVTRFNTQFQFQLLNPNADGFTFAIQGIAPTALGAAGGSLGYGSPNGIPNSIAVKFDLYSNQGETNNSTGLYTNGAAPTSSGSIDLGRSNINLHSGHIFNVAMSYDGATLKVTITDTSTGAFATQSYAVNIPSIVGANAAFAGFTGGTGGQTATQNILNWTYSTSLMLPAAPTNLSATAPSSGQVRLTWTDNSMTESGYVIERKTGASGVYGVIVQMVPGAASFTDSTVNPSTQYFYRVRAINAAGFSAYTNEASVTTSAAALPMGLNFAGGFAGASGQLALNGSATINGSKLRLTDGSVGQGASAFATSQVDITRFSTQFSFQIFNTTNPSADGFTFAIQGVGANAIGVRGGGLGYGPDVAGGSGGIAKSIAIKFDLYSNAGEGSNSTGLYTNGAAPTSAGSVNLTGSGIDLHSGHVFNVAMTYDGTTLRVTITDSVTNASATQSYTVNISSIVGSSSAFVGFTGGTGGLTADQNILNWTFSSPLTAPRGLTATPGAGQVALSWNATPGAATYNVYRSATSGGEGAVPLSTGITSTSFTDTGLAAGTTYYYQVTAVNGQMESPKSAEAVATTKVTGGLDFSGGFANAGSALTLNGSTAVSGSALQLTSGIAQAASAFSTARISVSRFSSQFRFQVQDTTDPGADGFTFCIQGTGANALGLLGGGLGYGTDAPGDGGGIPNSVAVKFDLFDNAGEGNDSTGLYTNGAAPTSAGSVDLTNSGIDLHSGHVFNVAMTYDGTTLRVTITDTVTNASATQSYAVNIASIVGSSSAFVGFTGGTGGLTANQQILSWTYTPA